jgi:prepilin-type N-terminal cleavage/methylation domain-containing protein
MTLLRINNRSGFTFVEVLLVVAIAGILATTSYAYMIGARPHAQLEAGELQLVSVLNVARKHAISEEVTTRVVFDPAGDQFWTEWQDAAATWHQIGAVEDLVEGVTFTGGGVTLAGSEARFTPRGTLHWGGTITIVSADGETSTLTANIATGKFPLAGGNLR